MPIQLLNMDCMEYMKNCGDKFFDLAICDPPYGIGADKKNSTDIKQSKMSAANSKDYGKQVWDNAVPGIDYFEELKRISKHQIIWGVNYYDYPLFKGGRIYWDKCVTMPTYSDGEIAYCSKINSVRSYKYAWHGMIQENMKDKEQRIHPTQKPVGLYKWLLKNYAENGQKIIDTHLGSASSAIAAHYFGCDFVGIEIDKDYLEAAQKRFAHETRQISMF